MFQIALKHDHEDMSQVLAKLMPSPLGHPGILDLDTPDFTSVLDLMQTVRTPIPFCRVGFLLMCRLHSLLIPCVQIIGFLGDK